jgi:hypothetical protein
MKYLKEIALAAVGLLFLFPATSKAQQPCLIQAWDSFNKRDYRSAIRAVDDCIENFGATAERQQKQLKDRHVGPPPTGLVSNTEKSAIFANAILNDVGTAYYIKGRSAEYLLSQTKERRYAEMAHTAYRGAMALSYARTFDPQGWFWSPAEAASDRLQLLPPSSPTKRN